MSDRPNSLGEYLRARRELMSPERAGFAAGGVRRTPGLRREEIALLAGISADYYLRLEQGRDRNPSTQVVDALAGVLELDTAATAHLHALAGASPRPPRGRKRVGVPTGILSLLEVIDLPAFVESRSFDVLAANPLATAVSPAISVGTNRLRAFLLDPAEKELWDDWAQRARGMVAGFRASVGTEVDDPATTQLVGELSLRSEEFRSLWARHDVAVLAGGSMRLNHPMVGAMELRREKLPLAGTDGQILAIYHAEAGSDSAMKLATLKDQVSVGGGSSAAGAAAASGPQ
ncbi:helix-turn-helix domain-containing protein [Williamsia herbipolensis]|uniref:helix-turn-helix domain-containing protein n=1 Tax=Williamsia herbipolensis TaxID=1603258 RepID=UPI0005F88909|nr:helix-turn-helix transcriptional regulator [Williamsia herbipolensis]